MKKVSPVPRSIEIQYFFLIPKKSLLIPNCNNPPLTHTIDCFPTFVSALRYECCIFQHSFTEFTIQNTTTMKSLPILAIYLMFCSSLSAQTQAENSKSEFEQITATLMDYIEGTANGEPERLRKAFHPSFNLYTVTADTLMTRSGEAYIKGFKPGEKANRIGRIISIDYEKDAATAKAEIVVPNWRIFTDYFLLMKYQGAWKIVQKSYTWRPYPKAEEKK
jgi:hypothetical protein